MLMACHLLYFIRQSKKSMKNKMIIVCVLLGLVLPLDGQTTLDDCIHYAWKHNLEFKNTQIEVQEAHTDYVAAMGKFMPSVSVGRSVWGIERSGFFNGREKWAKGFENQRV